MEGFLFLVFYSLLNEPLITIILLSYLIEIISWTLMLFFDSAKSASVSSYRYLFSKDEMYNWEKFLALLLSPMFIFAFILIYSTKTSFLWLLEKK